MAYDWRGGQVYRVSFLFVAISIFPQVIGSGQCETQTCVDVGLDDDSGLGSDSDWQIRPVMVQTTGSKMHCIHNISEFKRTRPIFPVVKIKWSKTSNNKAVMIKQFSFPWRAFVNFKGIKCRINYIIQLKQLVLSLLKHSEPAMHKKYFDTLKIWPISLTVDPYQSMSKQKILHVYALIQCEAWRTKTMQRQGLYSPRTPKWALSDKVELQFARSCNYDRSFWLSRNKKIKSKPFN